MLHDIGIFLTDATGIYCFGDKPYICHGYLGADLLRSEEVIPTTCANMRKAYRSRAFVTEIMAQNLPVPHREMLPVSMEEQVICFADKFYSKTHLEKERAQIRRGKA